MIYMSDECMVNTLLGNFKVSIDKCSDSKKENGKRIKLKS